MDYKKIGFKCGLEIHKQLETNKLFCNCPSIVHDKNPTIFFERKLRAVAGETGKVDAAALHEMKKEKTMKYEACSTSSCLIDMDEEPPKGVNLHALDTVLMVAMMFKAKIVDQVQVMRKTVVDGSNVSGFQRTMLVAQGGFIETSKGKVKIDSICLEEEAAKKVSSDDNSATYRLDRLGVPLIEIATDASIKDAEHAKETASLIGMVLKSTGRVKSGIGTIRQDVNVSIKGKSRVEIKGFQELKTIPTVVDNEIRRQIGLKESLPEVRRANPDGTSTFMRPMPGAARMYPETDVPVVDITKQMLGKIVIPELISEIALKYEKAYDLNDDLARELVEQEIPFDKYVKLLKNVEPAFIARTFIASPKEVKRRYDLDCELLEQDFVEILSYLDKGQVDKSAVFEMLVEKCKGKKINLSNYKKVEADNLEEEIKALIKKNPDVSPNALMGNIMKKYRGKVDGKRVMDLLKVMSK